MIVISSRIVVRFDKQTAVLLTILILKFAGYI